MAEESRQEAPASAAAASWHMLWRWHSPAGQSGTLDLELPSALLLGSAPQCDVVLPQAPPQVAVVVAQTAGLFVRSLHPNWPVQEWMTPPASPESRKATGEQLLLFPPCRFRIGDLVCEAVWSRPQDQSSDNSANLKEAGAGAGGESIRFIPALPMVWPTSVLEAVEWLQEQQRQFEQERQQWRADAEREIAALAQKAEHLAQQERELLAGREQLQRAWAALDADRSALQQAQERLELAQQQLHKLQEEMQRRQRQLDSLYQRRRDHLRALRESVRRAASKVQRQKRLLSAQQQDYQRQREELNRQGQRYQAEAEQLASAREQLECERQLVAQWQ
ncbi:MAG: hypothetical protein RMJ19_10205, partial [Gemmatales bacterium]|nr:hypothetical protein [Gemmatales bacterium]MDW8176032.1 hypothetical protein [Gemmatales bacterium]